MKKGLSISADLSNLERVEKFINSILDFEEIDERLHGNIILAVTEGVTNAVVHGNQNDQHKSVQLEYNSTKDVIGFKIKDQGNGFDYNNIPDPTLPENIEKLSGRGVFLISSLADKVDFQDNGSMLEMHFNLVL